jgi:hypothetical protein
MSHINEQVTFTELKDLQLIPIKLNDNGTKFGKTVVYYIPLQGDLSLLPEFERNTMLCNKMNRYRD